jgi:hypothetical protein
MSIPAFIIVPTISHAGGAVYQYRAVHSPMQCWSELAHNLREALSDDRYVGGWLRISGAKCVRMIKPQRPAVRSI